MNWAELQLSNLRRIACSIYNKLLTEVEFFTPPKKDTHKCGPMRVYPYFPASPSSKPLQHNHKPLPLQFPLPTPPKNAPELPKTSVIIQAIRGSTEPPPGSPRHSGCATAGLGLRQSSSARPSVLATAAGALEWNRSHPGKAKHFTGSSILNPLSSVFIHASTLP